MLVKVTASRIDNGWILVEQGKEADGTTYKHTRSFKDEKAILTAFSQSLEISQTKLTRDED